MPFNKSSAARFLSIFLILALNFGAIAQAQIAPTGRERTVTPPPQTRPTPRPSATPLPTPTPRPSTAPTPQVSPTPRIAPTNAPRTIEELRARIGEILRQPQLAPAQAAVKIVSLDTGRTLFEENTGRFVHPASNMKLFTVAAALSRLGADFRFTTSVYAQSRPDAAGVLRGDLIVYGRGDPSFAARFNDGDYFRAIDDLAGRIAAAGVRRIEGSIVGDESYFTGPPLGQGWEWDDLQWYYGAEVSALSVNDNSIDLMVRSGAGVGAPAVITTGPATPSIDIRNTTSGNSTLNTSSSSIIIINRVTTSAPGARRNLTVYRPLNSNTIEVSGSVPLDDSGYTGYVAISRPAMVFTTMLREALARRGVQVTGNVTTIDARGRNNTRLQTSTLVEIANRQSPPLSEIAALTLKPSQNLYTELILRALGERFRTNQEQTSVEAGIEAVNNFLREANVPAGNFVMADGSGLSRGNLVTANATTQLLTFMSRSPLAQVFFNAQPVAGVDGTLRTRMRGTTAEGNVRAKTGTLTGVTALSGYATSAAGERLAFSLIINNYPRDVDARTAFTDQIAVLIASFAGRS
jgi:serine-type D-Ala-D-Ala carboxypeptidase/endopeptidase (penicillin-binding protein 4)